MLFIRYLNLKKINLLNTSTTNCKLSFEPEKFPKKYFIRLLTFGSKNVRVLRSIVIFDTRQRVYKKIVFILLINIFSK